MKIIPPKSGDRFGRLVVIERIKGHKYWHLRCRCDCGVEKTVRENHVKSGASQSCGCLTREATARANTKHGDCRRLAPRAPEHGIWKQIIQRCTNPNDKGYALYGGRGIRICEEWLNSYEAFLAHVGRRPSKWHSIDRIENNGNYEPGNVKWATRTEQNNNRRANRFLECKGKRQTVAEWSRETGINTRSIQSRLKRGWSEEKALTHPLL